MTAEHPRAKERQRRRKARIARLSKHQSFASGFPKPGDVSEFEVQAKLYSWLTTIGFDVRGEVMVPGPLDRSARFDLVLYDASISFRVIEVKRAGRKVATIPKKYAWLKIPVDVVSGCSQAADYRDWLRGNSRSSLMWVNGNVLTPNDVDMAGRETEKASF